jgi:hypothetical protein
MLACSRRASSSSAESSLDDASAAGGGSISSGVGGQLCTTVARLRRIELLTDVVAVVVVVVDEVSVVDDAAAAVVVVVALLLLFACCSLLNDSSRERRRARLSARGLRRPANASAKLRCTMTINKFHSTAKNNGLLGVFCESGAETTQRLTSSRRSIDIGAWRCSRKCASARPKRKLTLCCKKTKHTHKSGFYIDA